MRVGPEPQRTKMHPRFDLREYYARAEVADFLKETLNVNLTSNFPGFDFTGSAYSKAYWENLQQKSLEIVGIRLQNILNPNQKLQTSNLSLKLVDPSSRRVIFASYPNLGTSSLKFYVPGPYIWLNGGQPSVEVARGLQTRDISVEVQGGSLDDLELQFDLKRKDGNSKPQSWDSHFDFRNKEYSDFEEDDWFATSGAESIPKHAFSGNSGFNFDAWAGIFGTRNPGSSSSRVDANAPDSQSRDVIFGVSSGDVDLATGATPPGETAPASSDPVPSSGDSFLGVRSADRLKVFLNSFERDLVVENETTFYFDDRNLQFSPKAPVFNLFDRELEKPFEYLPYQEKLVSWDYCALSFPTFDPDYLHENYGRETFKVKAEGTTDGSAAVTPPPSTGTNSLDQVSIPDSFFYQVPRESSALFWPLKLRLPPGVFRREFKISLDRNFPLGDYQLVPILKKTKTPLIYTRLNALDLKVTAIDPEQKETFSLQDPQLGTPNLSNSADSSLQLVPTSGRLPLKVLYNKNLYLNAETLPILIICPVAIDTVLYLDFYFKNERSFMRPVPTRVVLSKQRPRDLRHLGFQNSRDMFLKLPSASTPLHVIFRRKGNV